jgi:hypothetical protein
MVVGPSVSQKLRQTIFRGSATRHNTGAHRHWLGAESRAPDAKAAAPVEPTPVEPVAEVAAPVVEPEPRVAKPAKKGKGKKS